MVPSVENSRTLENSRLIVDKLLQIPHTVSVMELKNKMNFEKRVNNSLEEIIVSSGIGHRTNAYDMDALKRAIRKELRQAWLPKEWSEKED